MQHLLRANRKPIHSKNSLSLQGNKPVIDSNGLQLGKHHEKTFFRYNHTEFEPLLLRPAVGGAG